MTTVWGPSTGRAALRPVGCPAEVLFGRLTNRRLRHVVEIKDRGFDRGANRGVDPACAREDATLARG